MVSFWPFKGDETSAASFEKVLSQLATKINKASAQDEGLRQHQRRFKALWTLYTIFAYILVAAILTLVTGYQTWGAVEYSTVAGGPVLIFGVRTALDTYYQYRISRSQERLSGLYKQREAAIKKLKAATKYDSTQQLLDKYGGTPKKRGSSPQPPRKKGEGAQGKAGGPQVQRTGFAPPPTANISRGPSRNVTPQGPPPPDGRRVPSGLVAPVPHQSAGGANEEFAPNAFSDAPAIPPIHALQTSQQYDTGPKWYDRVMDVVLGEDETQAKNRLALICSSCRLVNGQAPPGARNLEDIGKWRCGSCHAWNGVESEATKVLRQVGQAAGPDTPTTPDVPTSANSESAPKALSSEEEDYDRLDEQDSEEEVKPEGLDTPPAASTRSKARQLKT